MSGEVRGTVFLDRHDPLGAGGLWAVGVGGPDVAVDLVTVDLVAVDLVADDPVAASRVRGAGGGYGRDMSSPERNVLGGELQECGTEPMTGFFRDGCCHTGPEDLGSHTICAVVTEEFLTHQRSVGNDLSTPRPQWHFPGLNPGDRWCVVAARWAQAYQDGAAAPVVLAATHERALEIVPLELLREHAVDVPDDLSELT